MSENILTQQNGVRGTSTWHSPLGQPVYLQPRAVNDEPVPNTSQNPESELEQSASNHNPPAAAENNDLEQGRQQSIRSEDDSHLAHATQPRHKKMWMVLLVLVVLSLIVVPGLVLGIVTKEIPVGIALSGAIATVTSVFAGVYYYNNK